MSSERLYPDSHVEIRGFSARHYDSIMDAMTLWTYPRFIRGAIRRLELQRGERVLVLGAGTGRNTCLMLEQLGDTGFVQAFDVGDEMIEQFRRRCGDRPNVRIEKRRIDGPLGVDEPFDKAFISFVFHGLPQDARLRAVEAVREALKPGGTWYVLDYSPELLRKNFLVRGAFKAIECPYAWDYLERGWPGALEQHGFELRELGRWYLGAVSLTAARKRD